ncbi:MAG: hypothetical protein WBG86_11505 [Polyangiales bacterium]
MVHSALAVLSMFEPLYKATLVLNVLWFGSAFWYFALKRKTAAKLLIPKSQRASPIFATMAAALPFLGGMNFAFSLLAAMLLAAPSSFAEPRERAILLVAFGVAHATQFLINVPVARRGGRIGESYWDVMRGPMLFIFVVDACMTALNLTGAALAWR